MGQQTFNATGADVPWVVPVGVTEVYFDIHGAASGQGSGASYHYLGGRVTGVLSVTPGETLILRVGSAGADATLSPGVGGWFNGGDGGDGTTGDGGAGGGHTGIFRASVSPANAVAVAGSAGGSNGSGDNDRPVDGHGGWRFDTEAVTADFTKVNGEDAAPGAGGGGPGGGWVQGAPGRGSGSSAKHDGQGGTNFARTTDTSSVNSYAGVQEGDGQILLQWTEPSSTAQDWYFTSVDQDFTAPSEGDIRALSPNNPTSGANATCAHGSGSGQSIITLDPASTRSTTGDARGNFGWAIRLSDMVSVSGALRRIPAGQWLFALYCTVPNANATGSITAYMQARVFRVSASGTRTALFTTGNSNSISTGLLGAGNEGVVSVTSNQGEIILQPGETIHVGFFSVVNQSAGLLGGTTAATIVYAVNGTNYKVQLPSPGLRTLYQRQTDDTAGSGSENLDRTVVFPRELTDSAGSGSDSLSRVYMGARTLQDTAGSVVDALERWVLFPRELVDSAGAGADTLNRQWTGNRQLADVAGAPADDLARVFTGARTLQDVAGYPVDSLLRQWTGARQLQDTVGPANDFLARQWIGARDINDTAGSEIETLSRQWVGYRVLADQAGSPIDTLNRQWTGARTLVDADAGTIADVLKRTVIFNRTLEDQAGTDIDALLRQWSGFRVLEDIAGSATDNLYRKVTYARTLEDDLYGGGSVTIVYRRATYIFGD